MSVGLVLIYGAVVGFIASKIRGSGFGLWWDVYLGVAGSALASSIMVSGYFMNVFANRDIVGMNLYSITVDITGALALIYVARFYHGAIHFRNWYKSGALLPRRNADAEMLPVQFIKHSLIMLDKPLRNRPKLAGA